MSFNGCPLQGTKFGYCEACGQEQTCVLLQILKKLEDVEKRVNSLSPPPASVEGG